MLISGSELEVLYGEEDFLGRSFLRRMAHKTAKVTRKVAKPVARVTRKVAKNPIAKAALYMNPITASAMIAPKVIRAAPKVSRVTSRVVRRAAPVAVRYTRQAVKAAAPLARQIVKNPLLQNAAASLVPGGATALNLYSRLTAAKKSIIPGIPSAATSAPRKPAPRKVRSFYQKRKAAPVSAPVSAPVPAATSADEGLAKFKVPLMVGGGVLAVGLLALALKGKSN